MNRVARAWVVSMIALSACGGAATTTAPPAIAPGAAPAGDTSGDDPETLPGNAPVASCEDRARTYTLCTRALTGRCQSQLNDCEATCESRAGLPGNTQKNPSNRHELDATRCRQDCRLGLDSCLRTLVPQCPRPCAQ